MKTRIIILTKFPEAGKVKTRLSKDIGSEDATDIYKAVLLDNWHNANRTEHDLSIEFSPPNSRKKFQELFGNNVILNPQFGTDIGWRMANAFASCFQQQFDAAILIGGDVPGISENLLNEALSSLEDNDIVLGPTYDGGYYLIGFRKDSYSAKLFQNIDWSTSKVLEQTLEIIRKTNNKLYLIENRIDLDTLDDVEQFLYSVEEKGKISAEIKRILKIK